MSEKWTAELMELEHSIEYLELFPLCAAILAWAEDLKNLRFTMFCNNKAVVQMVNHTTSGCKNCMVLIRLIVMKSLQYNFRVFATYVKSADNDLADALSRNQMKRFLKLCAEKGKIVNSQADTVPDEIWPPEKIWLKS